MAMDVAAFAHDVGHFARSNIFLVNTGHPLAIRYNDKSVLENMHAATCFEIMKEPQHNILESATVEIRTKFRSTVVDLILATDMKKHESHLNVFRTRFVDDAFSQKNADDRRLVGRCCLKCADLAHAAMAWEVHESWVSRLTEEFFAQADDEQRLGLPVSHGCERPSDLNQFRLKQKGFLEFMILPLYKTLAIIADPESSTHSIDRITENRQRWESGELSEGFIESLHIRPI